MSRYEGERSPQSPVHQELMIRASLEAVLVELNNTGLESSDVTERLSGLEVGDRFSRELPDKGVFTVERLNDDEYSVISSDRVEPVDTGFEQERTIYREIFQQQLEFVRLLHLENHQTIPELLDHYSNVIDSLVFDLALSEEVAAQLPRLKTEVVKQIADLSDIQQPDWTQRAWKVILDLYVKLEQLAELASPDFYEPRVGGLIYQLSEADNITAPDFGLSAHDRYLTLHFPINAVERARNRRVLPARSAFRVVAELIRDQNLDITAVTGASWLMGHPIAKRMGFEQTSISRDIFAEIWELGVCY